MQISSIRLDLNKTLGFINNREIDPKNVYRITNSIPILYELKSIQSAHVSNI